MKKGILLTLLSIFSLLFICSCSFTSDDKGTITVELVELDQTVAITKEIKFNEGDELVSLLEANFENVVVKDGMLISIEHFKNADDWSTWICIYVDNEMSNYGVTQLQFKDGTIISFRITEYIR